MRTFVKLPIQFCTLILLWLVLPLHIQAEHSKDKIPELMYTEINDETYKELKNLIESIFDELYQKENENLIIRPNKLKNLLWELKKKEKDYPDKIKTILFVRAEGNYKLRYYKKAYIIYYRLKILLSIDDPLYNIVETRMSELAKKVKPKEAPHVKRFEIIYFESVLVAVSIMLIIIIYAIDREKRKRSEIQDEKYDRRIVPLNEIIQLKEMCEQDGRCSYDAVEEYQKLITNNKWKNIAEHKREKLKFARLITEGHKMINEINDKRAPCLIKLISRTPLIGNLPLFWRYTLLGALFIGSWWLVGYLTKLTLISINTTYFLLGAFVISSLYGIHLMAEKTVDSIDEFVCMLEPEQELGSIILLQLWIKRLFNNVRQLYFPIIIMAIIVYLAYNNGKLFVDGKLNLDILFYTVLVLMTSCLIWFLFGSLIMMKNIFNLKDLSINPLSPSKTIGLEKWISVIGTYNMVCSIVLTFGCSIPVYMNYMAGGNLAHGSMWFFIITPILIFAWIYPYIKIGSLVKSKKMKRMNFIKTKISILFNEWVELENKILKQTENIKDKDSKHSQTIDSTIGDKKKIKKKLVDMENYYKVFQKIEESPESYFDLNSALELAKVLGFPSLFAIVSALLSYALI